MPCTTPVLPNNPTHLVQGRGVFWVVWTGPQWSRGPLCPGRDTGTCGTEVGHVICHRDEVMSCDHMQVGGEKGAGSQTEQ